MVSRRIARGYGPADCGPGMSEAGSYSAVSTMQAAPSAFGNFNPSCMRITSQARIDPQAALSCSARMHADHSDYKSTAQLQHCMSDTIACMCMLLRTCMLRTVCHGQQYPYPLVINDARRDRLFEGRELATLSSVLTSHGKDRHSAQCKQDSFRPAGLVSYISSSS